METKTLKLVIKILRRKYRSELRTQLIHKNTTELFVAALLSPQCSDLQVNKTTKELFKQFKTISDYDKTNLKTLQGHLKGLNYYKTKAKNLKKAARRIVARYGGKIPQRLDDLMTLQGVGRKVGNVILSEGYNIYEGIAIDTHCITVATRLKIERTGKPEKIESRLMHQLDRKYWRDVSNLFIALGRDTCRSRKKECERCVLNKICPSSDVIVGTKAFA